MAAAVQAMVGASVVQVLAEAESALSVKREQLGGEPEALPATTSAVPASAPSESVTLLVRNRLGLHARPAARFVMTAGRYEADIRVAKGNKTANAKSINQVAILGARQGDEIVVTATGPDAVAALAALQALAADNFGDRDNEPADQAPLRPTDHCDSRRATTDLLITDPPAATYLKGIPASPGVAVGPAALYRPRLPEVATRHVDAPADEWQRLQEAVGAARVEIETLHRKA